jgi:hypothetical protein
MTNEGQETRVARLLRMFRPPAKRPPVAQFKHVTAQSIFPEHIDDLGLPRDPMTAKAAAEFLAIQNQPAGAEHVFQNAQECWLQTDQIWQACKNRLGLEGVTTALEANARLEKVGAIEIVLPVTDLLTNEEFGGEDTSWQALVTELPNLERRLSAAFAATASIYEQAKSDYPTARGEETPNAVMNYSQEAFLQWARKKFKQPTCTSIEKFIENEKDPEKLAVLKMSLAFLEGDPSQRSVVSRCITTPSSIFSERRQLEFLSLTIPSSLPMIILNEPALKLVADLRAGKIRDSLKAALAGRQHSVTRRDGNELRELRLALPKEFTDRVRLTDTGVEIDLTNMGEAKIPMILGSLDHAFFRGAWFERVHTAINEGRAQYRTLSEAEIASWQEDPFDKFWRLDSTYLESKVGERDFSMDVYPLYLQLEIKRLIEMRAAVMSPEGRTGAGKSTLVKHIGRQLLAVTCSGDINFGSFGRQDNLVILRYKGPRDANSLLEALRIVKAIAEKRDRSRSENAQKGTLIVVEEADSIRWDPSLSDEYRELGEALQNSASDPKTDKRPVLGVFIIGELKEGQDELPEDKRSLMHGDASVFQKHRFNRVLVVLEADEAEAALISLLNQSIENNVSTIHRIIARGLANQLRDNAISRLDYDRAVDRLNQARDRLLPFLRETIEQMLTSNNAFVRLTRVQNKSRAAEYFNPTQMDTVIKVINQLLTSDITGFLNGSPDSTIKAAADKRSLAFGPDRLAEIQRNFNSVVNQAIDNAIRIAAEKGVGAMQAKAKRERAIAAVRAARAMIELQHLVPLYGSDGVALMAQEEGVIPTLIDRRLRERLQADDPSVFSNDFRMTFVDNATFIFRILKRIADPIIHKGLQTHLSGLVTLLDDDRWTNEEEVRIVQQEAQEVLLAILNLLGEEGVSQLRERARQIRDLSREAGRG